VDCQHCLRSTAYFMAKREYDKAEVERKRARDAVLADALAKRRSATEQRARLMRQQAADQLLAAVTETVQAWVNGPLVWSDDKFDVIDTLINR
jgi:hypothetical protein